MNMKKSVLFFLAALLLAACNPIPNKSIFEELTTEELASAIKSDDKFAEAYESIRTLVGLATLSEVQKAQYNEITYRRMAKYYYHVNDEDFWSPIKADWGNEWDNTFAKDLAKVDETSKYWLDYKNENSLSKFAKVELSDFYITHYSYIGGVDDAFIMFKITPLRGTIEQLKFTYSYSYKINGGKGKETHKCIYSSPIANTKEGAWEIEYLEKDKFDGMTVKKFLQQYDLEIEITDVRIGGKNYSLDDLNIPEAITNFWSEDTEETREEVAKLINSSYVNKEDYIQKKKDERMKEYDTLCYDFCSVAIEENLLINAFKTIFE